MPVREFELFHGAVLTKLVRSDTPITLRMIETRPAESWSSYVINDDHLIVKHSVTPKPSKLGKRSISWSFVFTPAQLKRIQDQVAAGQVHAALICGSKSSTSKDMELCLLFQPDLVKLLDLSTTSQQSITVRRVPGQSLRASSSFGGEIVVARNRAETWHIPGS